MDYQAEQLSELDLIRTVYPEELEVLGEVYPNIKLKIELPCVPIHENPEPDFYVTLTITLPEKYPDEPPTIQLEGFPDHVPKKSVQEIYDKLDEQSKSMPGYQVLITLVTEVQYSVPLLIKQLEKKNEELQERLKAEKEEAEQRKFEGNRVTQESFERWRTEFEKEFFAAELEAKKIRDAQLAGKLTGRQQFLKNSALDISDLSIIEKADAEAVDVDQSLFEEELSDLDIDDESGGD
ncbi:RWD domain containing protein [Aphelenchoides bicaudatus]|nr:RWD domain containing protein [Aphelenchoides bicaudatus]